MARLRSRYWLLGVLFAAALAFRVVGLAEQLPVLWQSHLPILAKLPEFTTGTLLPVFCVLLGFAVAFIRPLDPHAWLVMAMMVSFSHTIQTLPHSLEPYPVARALHRLAGGSWALWMALFGLKFPEPFEAERRRPWLLWLLIIAPNAALTIFETLQAVGPGGHSGPAGRTAALVYRMLCIGIMFFCLGIRSGTTRKPDARRRIRLLHWGAVSAFTPAFALMVASLTLGESPFSSGSLFYQYRLVATPFLVIFPISLAYVIIVHRALDVRIVLRQGVQYALARGGVRLLLATVAVSVLLPVGLAVKSGRAGFSNLLVAGGVPVLVFVLIRRVRSQLMAWVDRRFFRDAYNAEQILAELSDTVRTIVEEQLLLETVARRLAESLHVSRVAMLLRQDGSFCPGYALGYDVPPSAAFPASAVTVRLLLEAREPPRIYFEDPDSWVYRAPDGETDALRQLDSQLLLPLSVKENLLGFVSLGPKKSEEPYSRSDVRLLHSVATQTGLALENTRLSAEMARTIAQRERLHREIEIAREVQERLFPQKFPDVDRADYWGMCRSALAVGGDYYDFIALPGGRLGLAIGDVSGKGIAASLLMASLQACLRGQIIEARDDLACVMRNVNRLIYESSAANRYATFFYSQYDPETRRLIYVNAGHEPPLVVRCSGHDYRVIPLEAGGPVVGLLPAVPYQQGEMILEPGDLLIGVTDGISEAMNPFDEEWGIPRMLEAVRHNWDLPPRQLIPALIEAADAFAAGAPQHDDMTVVMLRLNPA